VTGVWLGNDNFTPMSRITGGSSPAEIWQKYMVASHDTDNIPQIPGLELHPVQVAEQERLRAVMAANATAETPTPQPVENVKDMSPATRQVLEKLSTLLKDARPVTGTPLSPRAEAPSTPPSSGDDTPKPSLAAASADGAVLQGPNGIPGTAQPESSLSLGRDSEAPLPQ
jgi:penicillin-binding protein 1A